MAIKNGFKWHDSVIIHINFLRYDIKLGVSW